jgi:hypothetical protein
MRPIIGITFRSVTLTEQRVRGEPDDHALSTIRLDLEYADRSVDRDLPILVWHGLGPFNGGIVRLIVRAAWQDVVDNRTVAGRIEAYYRRQIGEDGGRIHFTRPDATTVTLGGLVLRAPEHVNIPVTQPRRQLAAS